MGERAPYERERSSTDPGQQVGGLEDADEREGDDQPAAVDVREERQAYEEHRAGDHAVDERLARLLVRLIEPVDRRAEGIDKALQVRAHSPHRHLRRRSRVVCRSTIRVSSARIFSDASLTCERIWSAVSVSPCSVLATAS